MNDVFEIVGIKTTTSGNSKTGLLKQDNMS